MRALARGPSGTLMASMPCSAHIFAPAISRVASTPRGGRISTKETNFPAASLAPTLDFSAIGTGVKACALTPVPIAEKSKVGAKLAAGKFVSFVEILPPRGVDATREIAGAKMCAEHGIDAINVPDGPRASARMSAQVTCPVSYT